MANLHCFWANLTPFSLQDHNGGCGYAKTSSSLARGHVGPRQACCPGDERNMTVSMNQMSDCHWMHRGAIDFMGYTMRTETVRYTEWVKWDGAKLRPIWAEHHGLELYDHSSDNGVAPASPLQCLTSESKGYSRLTIGFHYEGILPIQIG